MPETLVGDQIRLKQVLLNLTKYLLKNSDDAAEFKLLVSYDSVAKQLTTLICNRGSSVNRQQIQELIDGQRPCDNTLHMGLRICQKIIKNLDGCIQVVGEKESRSLDGAIIKFTMKMATPGASPPSRDVGLADVSVENEECSWDRLIRDESVDSRRFGKNAERADLESSG